MMMDKMKISVKADDYLNHSDDYDDDWCEHVPVDLNHAFVPTQKHKSDNLKKTEENIRERFGL